MSETHLEVYQCAHFLLQARGRGAIAFARAKVQRMERDGDTVGADGWRRIVLAIRALHHQRKSFLH
jgi:hypothetical protein